jgi:tRNA(Ile)-lysidine synthase TilS/MesJ
MTLHEPGVCRRCILPTSFPGISFDAEGVCSHCRDAGPLGDIRQGRADALTALLTLADEHRGRGGDYDCIVAFSGGKDSSFTLQWVVQTARLRALAVTIDNGFISSQALANARAVTEALGVDWLVFRPAPAFMSQLYRESATRQLHPPAAALRASATCQSCIHLINTHMVRLAQERGTPLIAGGYLAGQVPRGAASLRLDFSRSEAARASTAARYREALGDESDRYMTVPRVAGAASITVINPLLAIPISENDLVASLAPLGWVRTSDTGRQSSNCRLNDLGIYLHQRTHGFNPYLFEMAAQVREGLMSRDEAFARASDVPSREAVEPLARQIGLELARE